MVRHGLVASRDIKTSLRRDYDDTRARSFFRNVIQSVHPDVTPPPPSPPSIKERKRIHKLGGGFFFTILLFLLLVLLVPFENLFHCRQSSSWYWRLLLKSTSRLALFL